MASVGWQEDEDDDEDYDYEDFDDLEGENAEICPLCGSYCNPFTGECSKCDGNDEEE